MRKDQRNLVLSIALASTVIASVATPVVVASSGAFLKYNPGSTPTASAFDKWSPSASNSDIFLKI